MRGTRRRRRRRRRGGGAHLSSGAEHGSTCRGVSGVSADRASSQEDLQPGECRTLGTALRVPARPGGGARAAQLAAGESGAARRQMEEPFSSPACTTVGGRGAAAVQSAGSVPWGAPLAAPETGPARLRPALIESDSSLCD